MRKKIRKLIRRFKRGDYSKKVIITSLAVTLCLGVLMYKGFIAKAYPGTWDIYTGNSGIFNTIYNYEKATMNKYDSAIANSYTVVHNTATDGYQSAEGK